MAKPRHPAENRPETSKGPGDEDAEVGSAEGEAEERGGKQGDKAAYSPPPEGERNPGAPQGQREWGGYGDRGGRGVERGGRVQGRRYPKGGTGRGHPCGGGCAPPQRKTRTSRALPLKVRTCCFRGSVETTRITTMGFTWTGELQTTLYSSVVGAGLLHSHQSGMPHPLEQ